MKMREKISRISLIVYLVLFILSAFLACCPGDRVVWLCIMGIFAVVPIIAGPKRYRILGVIALVVAVVLLTVDYRAGKKFRDAILRQVQQSKEPKTS